MSESMGEHLLPPPPPAPPQPGWWQASDGNWYPPEQSAAPTAYGPPPAYGGVGYGYADPRLEELTAAQKHLLRTGPRNALVIQTSLRAIALALGIPPERLPNH